MHLTRKGKRLLEATMNKVTERESEWIEAALNEGELDQLNQLLGKVLGVLEQRK